MKKRFPILIILAWVIIGLWLTRTMIFSLLNIDFASAEIAQKFRKIWLILIPAAVGILIIKSWKETTSSGKKAIGLTIGVLVSVGLIIIFNFFAAFVGWRFSEPIYTHKSKNVQIREHVLDHGAWDSDPTHQLVETRALGAYLLKYKEVNEEDIDQDKWVREWPRVK